MLWVICILVNITLKRCIVEVVANKIIMLWTTSDAVIHFIGLYVCDSEVAVKRVCHDLLAESMTHLKGSRVAIPTPPKRVRVLLWAAHMLPPQTSIQWSWWTEMGIAIPNDPLDSTLLLYLPIKICACIWHRYFAVYYLLYRFLMACNLILRQIAISSNRI